MCRVFKRISLGIYVSRRGSHISRDMFFPVRETDITKKQGMNRH